MSIDKENRLLISIKPRYFDTKDKASDVEELVNVTDNLREDLNQLDVVEDVHSVSEDKPPQGSKSGGDISSWGSLLVTMATSGTRAIPALVGALQSWLINETRFCVDYLASQPALRLPNIPL
ncbi:MAG: hypothetical protein WB511_13905 [Nitrososphaeraceae archaeon]